jgi:sugar phosphate isomerase/epimerase
MMNRREFVGAAASSLVAGCAGMRAGTGAAGTGAATAMRLPMGFSTLGTPKWDWIPTLDFAAAHGFASVELRGIRDTMDLSQRPEFQSSAIAQTRRELRGRGLVVPVLGASINMHEKDTAKYAEAMAETRRFIDVASALGTPYVRVFGNTLVKGAPRAPQLAYIARGLRELGAYAQPRNVVILLESHGDFVDSPTLLEIMRLTDSSAVALLWDAHHTFVGGESPETSVRELGRFIRHTHLKDSVPAAGDRRYVLTGTGEVPVRRQVEALARSGYRGFYNFEWEKRWHPEIEEPEVAIAQYATVVGGYLRDAGVAPIAVAG